MSGWLGLVNAVKGGLAKKLIFFTIQKKNLLPRSLYLWIYRYITESLSVFAQQKNKFPVSNVTCIDYKKNSVFIIFWI